jgi:hypothetical protein
VQSQHGDERQARDNRGPLFLFQRPIILICKNALRLYLNYFNFASKRHYIAAFEQEKNESAFPLGPDKVCFRAKSSGRMPATAYFSRDVHGTSPKTDNSFKWTVITENGTKLLELLPFRISQFLLFCV